jgi:hypothetical protein
MLCYIVPYYLYIYTLYTFKSWGRSVGIVTGNRLDDQGSGVQFPMGAGNSSLNCIQTSSGARPPIEWVLGVKWPGHEADHSPSSVAEVKNVWHYTSLHYIFIAWCLVKQKDGTSKIRMHFSAI